MAGFNKVYNLFSNIKPTDRSLGNSTQEILDNLTKPKDSLGDLEEVVKKLASILGTPKPKISEKYVFVLAADHGIAEEKVSKYPQEVTYQMVFNFLNGKAAVNVLSRYVNADLYVVDMGVKHKFSKIKSYEKYKFLDRKISFGTKNFLKQRAMTLKQAKDSLLCGINLIEDIVLKRKRFSNATPIVAIGDMGIGNTTTAAAITAVITNCNVEDIVGYGTGIDELQYKNKIKIVRKVIKKYKFNLENPVDLISKIGGFEISAMVGIILACAYYRIPIVLDGFITTSAALIASCFNKYIKDYVFAGHLSYEKGHKLQLDYLGINPLLKLNMRLGEATGAVLSLGLIEASCKIVNEMATFEEAKVSKEIS
ncbi:MAG: nicotinate-nucleotide--dimethylbenzimidazole phosphoribosyltransferase [Endomicrobia bacterium]|nr:nicotinate-nucleotide--dimethylbenzimidazole phosphoribosyltransferase [Endomicrobiia bacterium]